MKIAVDIMGGDRGIGNNVAGSLKALETLDIELVLVGRENDIALELESQSYDKSRLEIVNADEVITNEDEPAMAVRKKKNSSIVIGMNLLKEGKVDAFVSSGNTGALLSGGLLIVKRIKGIDRPALGVVYPNRRGPSFLLDVGANADCKPKYLQQFAVMGSIYSKEVLGVENPRTGIVNIGAEKEKGNELTKASFELLENTDSINFVGNVEAREIPDGEYDVLVCDGFTGNVILKLSEGLAMGIFSILKDKMKSSIKNKLGALLLKSGLYELKSSLDYSEYGGAALLGIKAPVIKAHGSSDEVAIMNAIRQAKLFVEYRVVDRIEENIALLGGDDSE
ncbi:phosphate acyltransferase [Andreesenia angusta]|uniref:Phosphate acyltransferase n=1 Tax=Andreesenia angusta TaxID=39480 RepID=A0A1S1V7U1_9FIRM|nr:phosphate acyltransferase PlsX [Andreesenia angusta]OHW62668.1 phosphate acyltransferase [Andreesenia angusta]